MSEQKSTRERLESVVGDSGTNDPDALEALGFELDEFYDFVDDEYEVLRLQMDAKMPGFGLEPKHAFIGAWGVAFTAGYRLAQKELLEADSKNGGPWKETS